MKNVMKVAGAFSASLGLLIAIGIVLYPEYGPSVTEEGQENPVTSIKWILLGVAFILFGIFLSTYDDK